MNYLRLDSVSKAYGDKVLFQDIDLYINKGDKVALIARNGTGKTSLIKIIAGIESPDGQGESVHIHPEISIGILKQNPDFSEAISIGEYMLNANNNAIKALKRYNALMDADADSSTGVQSREMQAALAEMEKLKAWDAEAEIDEILDKLSIPKRDAEIETLSGGQKKRLALARLLIEEPDFIILDEPTNHLDLAMIEWLEHYLSSPDITFLLITHDRYFLDRLCDTILELEGGTLHKFSGNYSDYLEKKGHLSTIVETTLDKQKKLLRKEKEWINRMPKARGTKNKARIKQFVNLKEQIYGHQNQDELHISLKPQRLGAKIIELHQISKSYPGKKILDKFTYKFKKHEKLGIVGPNGAGKTSFLKLITGETQPDTGKIVIGDTVKIGYYTQDKISLKNHLTVLGNIREIAEFIPLEKGKKLSASALLEEFLFPKEQQRVKVEKLSGGEKRRLYLLTILMKNPNVLILDEPSNDLDILTLNILEEYLISFPGVVIIVSHDRYFMDKIVDHLFVMEADGGKIKDFPGSYSQYREVKSQWTDSEAEESREIDTPDENEVANAPDPRTQQKKRRRLENKLSKLENKKKELEEYFLTAEDYQSDEFQNKSEELTSLKEDIEAVEEEWFALAEGG